MNTEANTNGADKILRNIAAVLDVLGLSRSDTEAAAFTAIAEQVGVTDRDNFVGLAVAARKLLTMPGRMDRLPEADRDAPNSVHQLQRDYAYTARVLTAGGLDPDGIAWTAARAWDHRIKRGDITAIVAAMRELEASTERMLEVMRAIWAKMEPGREAAAA